MSWISGRITYGKGNESLCGLVKVPAHTVNALYCHAFQKCWCQGRIRSELHPSFQCVHEKDHYPLCPSATSHTISPLVLEACTMIWPGPSSSLQRQSAAYNRDAVNQSESKNPLSVTANSLGWFNSVAGDFEKQSLHEVTEEKIISQDYKQGWITPHC